ncbi:MAG TPA: hypothetical protein VD931_00035 [Baekduia sp.]|nr:hypothetical protein [Baekduia sp.]
MGTAAELRSEARRLRQEAEAHERQAQALRAAADARDAMAAELESLDAGLKAAKGLRSPKQDYTLSRDMNLSPEVRQRKNLALSAGKSRDPMVQAANAAGFSMRSLAKALKPELSVGSLSQYRARGKAHSRPVPRWVAEQIERLTGFRATASNWPNGISQ